MTNHNRNDRNPNDNPHPAQKPQGGHKDTDDLSGIKGVQRTDMQEKAGQVKQTPKDVTGEHDGMQPKNQRR